LLILENVGRLAASTETQAEAGQIGIEVDHVGFVGGRVTLFTVDCVSFMGEGFLLWGRLYGKVAYAFSSGLVPH
jgi:hypothetical protein